MSRAAIYISNPPADTPPHYLDSLGRLALDLDASFNFRQERVGEELNDINKITAVPPTSFTLKSTPKNNWIANQVSDVQALDLPYPAFAVLAMSGSSPLRQNILQFVDGKSGEWEVELIEGDEHWITAAENKALQDCPLGTVDFTEANIDTSWNNPSYVDGTVGVAFPPINFGKLIGNHLTGSTVQDYRPLHSYLYVLQQGFCAIGWKFR